METLPSTQDFDFMKSLESMVQETEQMKVMCKKLMATPHYARMKEEGIFAICTAAKTYGVHPFEALNGGFHFIQGRVSMSAELMSKLIRSKGHSIIKDPASDSKKCRLTGKRADNGDTIQVTYTIEEAERAGYLKKDNWVNHPQAMLYAYCLRTLARQLFSDVIFGVLGEGEDPSIEEGTKTYASQEVIEIPLELTQDQADELKALADQVPDISKKIMAKAGIVNWINFDPKNLAATKSFLETAIRNKKAEEFKAAAEGE